MTTTSREIAGRRALEPAVARDVDRIWHAYGASELGSAVGTGALPLVAILVLHASAGQVAVLAAIAGVVAALLVIPLGPALEYRPKRPVMVLTDLARFVSLLSVPVAAVLGRLSLAQLLVVGVVDAVARVCFLAASGAHLKAMVPARCRLWVTSRMETTFWSATTVGPPIGGALVGVFGAPVTMAVDAISFLVSAVLLRGLRTAEPRPTPRPEGTRPLAAALAGWRYLCADRRLRGLWWNSLLFGAGVMLAAPLLPVLLVRDLGLPAWSYGVAIGIAGVGGVLGAVWSRRLVPLFGERRVLLGAGVIRAVWPIALAFAPAGVLGWVWVAVAEFGLLVSAGVFNPVFAAHRLRVTADDRLTRVLAAWAVSSRLAQPAGMLLGAAVASVASTRVALGAGGVVVLVSVLALPWKMSDLPNI